MHGGAASLCSCLWRAGEAPQADQVHEQYSLAKARKDAGRSLVRVHDLKHTFGRRLRNAGVSLETRKVLIGHKNWDITGHYSAPELAELISAANAVFESRLCFARCQSKRKR